MDTHRPEAHRGPRLTWRATVAAACCVAALTARADEPPAWPALAGPLGTFATAHDDTRLVDDLGRAVKAWDSECGDLGRAKGGSQAFRTVEQFTAAGIAKHGAHPGSWSGPIVGGGCVFVASWRPVGPWFAVEGHEVRLDAEDIVVAIDPETGRTKWLAAEPGGMLRGGGKREGLHAGPVFHEGTVYSLGSTGRLFAHDAATGAKRWESDAHPQRAACRKARDEALAGLAAGRFKYDLTPDWCASLAVVGGMLVVPDMKDGLVGIDLRDGSRRWAATGVTTRWATPACWRHDGREYLLVANEKGELRLLDPTDGRELWKLAGLGPSWPTLTPGRTHVLVNGVPDSGKRKDQPRLGGRYVAVRLGLDKGERDWSAPQDHVIPVWMDSGARQRVVYRNGAFLLTQCQLAAREAGRPEAPSEEQHISPAYVLDEATGRVIARLPSTDTDDDLRLDGLVYWHGDRLISRGDSYHGPSHGGRHPWSHWRVAGGEIRKLPGTMDLSDFMTAYEVPAEVPLVAGRMFERTQAGGVVCYDLRAH